MYIFTPNTLIESAKVNANFDSLLSESTVDANGWTKYDFKPLIRWAKSFTVTSLAVNSGQRNTAVNDTNGPEGITLASGSYITSCTWQGGYSGHAVIGVENAVSNTFDINIGNQYSGGSLNFTGTAYVEIMEL